MIHPWMKLKCSKNDLVKFFGPGVNFSKLPPVFMSHGCSTARQLPCMWSFCQRISSCKAGRKLLNRNRWSSEKILPRLSQWKPKWNKTRQRKSLSSLWAMSHVYCRAQPCLWQVRLQVHERNQDNLSHRSWYKSPLLFSSN